ncbi:hypothetical protein LMG28727_03720 [Paraburkholderia kirstenboschensis]|uniref:hypothetical protein n=1 Tax=Paraburkholderia kirstenboschensis TaxID=1245436 RepID=UPI000B189ADF|nr:hypothetical protein [Paraburkholderia kirstenboschensis]CAD6540057.1 hypothetical protein LMG28727_03720 [Paraburkholderia kirstenboschensis]
MRKSLVAKLLRYVVWMAISLTGGWRLTYHIDDMFPGNMPDSVDMFIRFCLEVVGRSDLANPDDMEVLALLLYWAVAALLVGALLFLCYIGARALLLKRRP